MSVDASAEACRLDMPPKRANGPDDAQVDLATQTLVSVPELAASPSSVQRPPGPEKPKMAKRLWPRGNSIADPPASTSASLSARAAVSAILGISPSLLGARPQR